MKQLTCEMCGCTELLKQDGVFVCQQCGTKYSVEEAKKMMGAENTVVAPVQIKAEISNNELENLYQLARRARDDDNSENAAKYYDMILLKDPTSWEANFYQVYYTAMQCKIGQIQSAANSISNCLESVLNLVHDHTPQEKYIRVLLEIYTRCSVIANMLISGAKNHYFGIDTSIRSNYYGEYLDRCRAGRNILYILGDSIEDVFNNEDDDVLSYSAEAWKMGISLHDGTDSIKESYIDKVGKYDENYTKLYYLNKKRSDVQLNVNILKNKIATTETDRKWKTGPIIAIFFGVGLAFLCYNFINVGVKPEPIIFFGLIAVFLIFSGIILGKPTNKKIIDKNIADVEQAKKDLEIQNQKLIDIDKEIERLNDENE